MDVAKILLIDDDEEVRYALGKYLRRAGHEVSDAGDGKVGLALLAGDTYDVVITDIIMPDVDGIEVLTAVRKRDAALPIIAISGGGRIGKAEYLSLAEELGANVVMQKPLDLDLLLQQINRLTAAPRPSGSAS